MKDEIAAGATLSVAVDAKGGDITLGCPDGKTCVVTMVKE